MQSIDNIPRVTLRRRALQLACTFALSMGATLLAMPGEALADPQTNCPAGSAGDHAFKAANLSKCVYVNTDHNKKPTLYGTVDYNIYCPGRIPVNDALKQAKEIGKKIASGAMITNSENKLVNPIISQHNAAKVKPVFVDTPHVFHYGCHTSSGNGVATHIKVRVKAVPLVGGGGSNCVAFGSQNGDIEIGAPMDREYRCKDPMIHATQRGGFGSDVKKIATWLLENPPKKSPALQTDVAKAKKLGGKICLLQTTDIQCAPCTWSDKLIVRVKTVKATESCPAGSQEVK